MMTMTAAVISAASLFHATLAPSEPVAPVVTETVVAAPVSKVWQAFTTKEGIESWMTAKTEFELKVGSTWRTSYNKDSDLHDDATIQQEVLSFDPERMLSFRTARAPKGFPWPEAVLKTWCVIYFEPVDAAKTKVTFRMMGFDETEESKKMREFFVSGNRIVMDALVKRFSNSDSAKR